MQLRMSFIDGHGAGVGPARYTPPPTPLTQVTQRDMAAAARLGVQAVPVRPQDPVTGPAKRERAADSHTDRKASSDRDRLDALRWAALRRDAAAITGR
jgi:hypothetical protein